MRVAALPRAGFSEFQIPEASWGRSAADSISEKLLEPLRRQGRIARRALDVAMPEIRLDRMRIVSIVLASL